MLAGKASSLRKITVKQIQHMQSQGITTDDSAKEKTKWNIRLERAYTKNQNMLTREEQEFDIAKNTQYVLIYPLVSYKKEFKIESLY
jgi:hypothetical protein